MNRFQKYLASILVLVIFVCLSFPNDAFADSGHAIEQKRSDEKKGYIETAKSVLGNFCVPSTPFIVASTAGIGLFSAAISYWYFARNQIQPNDGAQNAGLAIMGAIVQANLPEVSPQDTEFPEIDGNINSLEQQAGISLDILLQHETHPIKEDETTDQSVVEQVVEKPKRRAKTIAGSRELLESAQRFLGNNDYSAPRASRYKKERK